MWSAIIGDGKRPGTWSRAVLSPIGMLFRLAYAWPVAPQRSNMWAATSL